MFAVITGCCQVLERQSKTQRSTCSPDLPANRRHDHQQVVGLSHQAQSTSTTKEPQRRPLWKGLILRYICMDVYSNYIGLYMFGMFWKWTYCWTTYHTHLSFAWDILLYVDVDVYLFKRHSINHIAGDNNEQDNQAKSTCGCPKSSAE